MPESFQADTQYNDLIGTVAIDGHDGSFLHDLAPAGLIPEDFKLLGFELSSACLDDSGRIPVTLIAADCRVVGHSMEDMIAYGQTHGELPVRRFRTSVDPVDLPALIKRVDMKVHTKALKGVRIEVLTSSDP